MLSLNSFIEKMSDSVLVESNTFNSKKHEDAFAALLEDSGFEELDYQSDFAKEIKIHPSMSRVPELCGQYVFIPQPFGSQMTPDFIVVIDGWVLYVEMKRTKGKKISWNTGFPKNDYLYIFDSGKLGRIIFFGDHHPGYGGKENYYNSIVDEVKSFAKSKFDSTPFDFYMRKMINDKGDYDKDVLYKKTLDKVNKAIKIEL